LASKPKDPNEIYDANRAIKESKSVDALLILEKREKLMSMTAD
jgi:hypothetical protein